MTLSTRITRQAFVPQPGFGWCVPCHWPGVTSFWKEDHKDEMSSSRHVMGIEYRHDISTDATPHHVIKGVFFRFLHCIKLPFSPLYSVVGSKSISLTHPGEGQEIKLHILESGVATSTYII